MFSVGSVATYLLLIYNCVVTLITNTTPTENTKNTERKEKLYQEQID